MSPQERKAKSEEYLRTFGVDIDEHLPLIESEEEARIRTPQEIAKRAICLTAVTSCAYGDDKAFLIEYLNIKSCYQHLTNLEKIFFNSKKSSRLDEIKYSWQIESLRILLWSIGYANIEPLTFSKCDAYKQVYNNCSSAANDGTSFINNAKLLSKVDILELSDIIYRAHWAVRQNSIDGSTKIGQLDPGVVLEYHRAINWVTRYEDLDWDNVTTDT